MLSVLQFLSTACAGLFAGAALYINVAEHPARLMLEPSVAVAEWAPSYHRATFMQAPLALVSALSGIGVTLLQGGITWLIAGLCIGAVVPFTLIVIRSTNAKLLEGTGRHSAAEIRDLLVRWGQLHAVRTALSSVALVLMLAALTF
jgi:hypothetical protein